MLFYKNLIPKKAYRAAVGIDPAAPFALLSLFPLYFLASSQLFSLYIWIRIIIFYEAAFL